MKTDFCQFWLTCKDEEESSKIANTLLVKYLIVCARQVPIKADYRWKDKVEHSSEILLIMDSKLEFFEKIETEIAKLHSYDTFVLQAVPIDKISTKAEGWLQDELVHGKK